LVPGTILNVLQNRPPIIRSDGKFVRDYVYVKDAVNAYMMLAERLPGENFVGEAFNFGPERPLSVLEMVNLILGLMDVRNLAPVILNQASHEIREQYLDCSKAKKMLGWLPQFTVEAGLRQTIAWYSSYIDQSSNQ
jgi:CDP-glucose 4,6-dehydratase